MLSGAQGFTLGTVLYPNDASFAEFGVTPLELVRHSLVTGKTGSGKSSVCFLLLQRARQQGIPFWVFDFKRTYRNLYTAGSEFADMLVFTIGRDAISPLRVNPLIPPPNVEPGWWMNALVDISCASLFAGQGVEWTLRHAIRHTYCTEATCSTSRAEATGCGISSASPRSEHEGTDSKRRAEPEPDAQNRSETSAVDPQGDPDTTRGEARGVGPGP